MRSSTETIAEKLEDYPQKGQVAPGDTSPVLVNCKSYQIASSIVRSLTPPLRSSDEPLAVDPRGV